MTVLVNCDQVWGLKTFVTMAALVVLDVIILSSIMSVCQVSAPFGLRFKGDLALFARVGFQMVHTFVAFISFKISFWKVGVTDLAMWSKILQVILQHLFSAFFGNTFLKIMWILQMYSQLFPRRKKILADMAPEFPV